MDDTVFLNKYIKVMFDYSSTGLWGKDGISLDYEDLPISPFLLIKVDQWVRENDRDLSLIDSLEYKKTKQSLTNEEEQNLFELKQKCRLHLLNSALLACEIKEQLPDWTITLFYEDDFKFYNEITNLKSENDNNKIIPIDLKQKLIDKYQ